MVYCRPAFATCDTPESMQFQDPLTHSLDFTNLEQFNSLTPKQPSAPLIDKSESPSTSRTSSPCSPRSKPAGKVSSGAKPKGYDLYVPLLWVPSGIV